MPERAQKGAQVHRDSSSMTLEKAGQHARPDRCSIGIGTAHLTGIYQSLLSWLWQHRIRSPLRESDRRSRLDWTSEPYISAAKPWEINHGSFSLKQTKKSVNQWFKFSAQHIKIPSKYPRENITFFEWKKINWLTFNIIFFYNYRGIEKKAVFGGSCL